MRKLIKQLLLKISPTIYTNIIFNEYNGINWEKVKRKNIENELLLLKYFLTNKNDVFVDVGANLGIYLFIASKKIKRENIYAFEPHGDVYKKLKQMFKSINLYDTALSNQVGLIEFKIPIFDGKEIHTRGKLNTNFIEDEETDSKINLVKVNKLDNFINVFSPKKVKLIKIDVEGAEFDVLEGAEILIKKDRPYLIVEIEQRHSHENILDRIKEFNNTNDYSTFIFKSEINKIVNLVEVDNVNDIQDIKNHTKNKLYINNFIFIPNEKLKDKIIENINYDLANI